MIEIDFAYEMDIDGITALESDIFSDAWHRNSIEETLHRDYITTIVARDGETICGYLICYRIINEGEIARVGVHEDYRRRGIAARMLEFLFLEGEKSGLDAYSLEVRESNSAAIALYEKYSFASEGRRKNFYSSPVEDGLIMWRR